MIELPPITPTSAFLLIGCGFLAAIINTLAGGGSMLTLPLLVALGLPATTANGTNRLFMLVQSASSTIAMATKNEARGWHLSLRYLIIIFPAAITGAWLATIIPPQNLQRIMGALILAYVAYTLIQRFTQKQRQHRPPHPAITIALFLLLGLYGGFMQAGMGAMLFWLLHSLDNTAILKSMTAKNAIITLYTLAVFAVFITQGQVAWLHGLLLAAGSIIGALTATAISQKCKTSWIEIAVTLLLGISGCYLIFSL